MTTTAPVDLVYVVRLARVRQSIETLLARQTHPYFIAYLHLRRTAARQGRLTGLTPNWAALGNLLEVPGAPPGKPFLRPFWKGQRDAHQEWLNANLAGSFAPSSLRGVPLRVVDTDAQGRFLLRERHWELAREHLLLDNPMPVLALAAFLFRDLGLYFVAEPGPATLIELFRREYGYSSEDETEFNELYDTSWTGGSGPWLEPLSATEIA